MLISSLKNDNLYFCLISTPIGLTLLTANQNSLVGSWTEGQKNFPSRFLNVFDSLKKSLKQSSSMPQFSILKNSVESLMEYFSGSLKYFEVNLNPTGTEFQLLVWQGLKQIEYGKTLSYQGLAEFIGKPKAIRAVASACAKNPIGLFIPCHRVIGKNNSLTGFASGIKNKEFLLNLESRFS